MRMPRCFALFAALIGVSTLGFAQIGTSTMTGRVTDTTGAVVPRVQVTIVQTATNFKFSAVTNEEGIYRVPSLQPGQYRVTFEASGFKRLIRDEVDLRTGDVMAVDVALQVGAVSESVEVTGATTLLETETSATGTLVSGNVLYDMPLYQRYVVSTLNLVPGMTSGGYAYGGDLGAYHLAGQRSGAIGIFEDGVNGNDQLDQADSEFGRRGEGADDRPFRRIRALSGWRDRRGEEERNQRDSWHGLLVRAHSKNAAPLVL